MGLGPDEVDEIRRQIAESRENLGAAVGALAYKADIKNRGKEALEDKKEAVMEKVDELKDKLPDGETIRSKLPDGVGDAVSRIGDAAPSTEDIKRKAQDAGGVAQDHPIAVVAGAAAAGLVAGLAIPETDLEREKLGPTARNVREQVQERAQDIIEQVKDGAKDAVSSVADAVKDKGQEHGGKIGEIAEKAADKTWETVEPAG
jgi:gas vesicle protein